MKIYISILLGCLIALWAAGVNAVDPLAEPVVGPLQGTAPAQNLDNTICVDKVQSGDYSKTPIEDCSDQCNYPDGQCTIYKALNKTLTTPGGDNIIFDQNLPAPVIIEVGSTPLSVWADLVTMDGGGRVEIRCLYYANANQLNAVGLKLGGDENTIRGFIFNRCYLGLDIYGNNNFIQKNCFGTDVTCTKLIDDFGIDTPNKWMGLVIRDDASNNLIGSQDSDRDGNIIAGNKSGMWIIGQGGVGNVIAGNKIGVGRNGEQLGNTLNGITITNAPYTLISSNIISNNGGEGILIDSATDSAVIESNIVSNNVSGIVLEDLNNIAPQGTDIPKNLIFTNTEHSIEEVVGANGNIQPPETIGFEDGVLTGAALNGAHVEVFVSEDDKCNAKAFAGAVDAVGEVTADNPTNWSFKIPGYTEKILNVEPQPIFTVANPTVKFAVTQTDDEKGTSEFACYTATASGVVANAGPDAVRYPGIYEADGSGSFDTFGGTLQYQWSKPVDTDPCDISTSDKSSVKMEVNLPTQSTDYQCTFGLTVTSTPPAGSTVGVQSDYDEVMVSVKKGTATSHYYDKTAAINHPPVADAGGPDISVYDNVGTFTLDGSGSSDPDGDALTFAWNKMGSSPCDFKAITYDSTLLKQTVAVTELVGSTLVKPTISIVPITERGVYNYTCKFSLTVNDGKLGSEPAEVTVTVMKAPLFKFLIMKPSYWQP